MLRDKWWEIYQDPQLNSLEDRIAANNQSLRQALETYLAARDQVSAARANLFPTLSGNLSASRDQVSANRPTASKGGVTNYSDLAIGGQASWEPDFWGRIRRTVEAARENSQASAADMANIDLSLHAEMAADYFQLRGLDAQTKLLTATVRDLENQLDLTQQRLAGGVATAADVALARTQLETVSAQLVDIGVARAQFEHAIGTIANYNLSDFSIPPSPLDIPVPKVPVGVPSQLLQPSVKPQPPMSKLESPSAPSIPPLVWAEPADLRVETPEPGFRARVRSGRSARRPPNCSSTPASAAPSPAKLATTTRPRLPVIGTLSFRPSTTSKTSSQASEFWNRNQSPNNVP
jgi:hypothetical protein